MLSAAASIAHTAATPVVLGLAAAVVWGAADFYGGLAARRGWPGWVVLIAHGTSLLVLASLTSLLHAAPLPASRQVWGLLSGVSGAVGLMIFYEALAGGAMGLSAAIAGLLTAAVPVAVAWQRQGQPGAWQLGGFAIAALAIGLIAWPPSDGEGQTRERASPRTLLLATLAGVGFGSQLVILHLASGGGSVVRALTLSRIGGTATGVAAVLLLMLRGKRMLVPEAVPASTFEGAGRQRSPRRAGAMFLLLASSAGLLDAGGNGLYMRAAQTGRLDVAAVLSSLYPGATILLAVWILKERTSGVQALGMVLALVAVALISL